MQDIEPWTYLRDVLSLLPRYLEQKILDLASAYWELTHQRDDIRRWLDHDPFRAADLQLAAGTSVVLGGSWIV